MGLMKRLASGGRSLPTRANAIVHFSWEGKEQLIRNLHMLDNALPRIIRPALRSGAMLVARAAQRHAEKAIETGTLQASIGVKVWSNREQTHLIAYVGPRRRRGRLASGVKGRMTAGDAAYSKESKRHEKPPGAKLRIPTRYAHFVEDRIHFMKQAMDEAGDIARFRTNARLWKGVEREVAKMPKVRPISR